MLDRVLAALVRAHSVDAVSATFAISGDELVLVTTDAAALPRTRAGIRARLAELDDRHDFATTLLGLAARRSR